MNDERLEIEAGSATDDSVQENAVSTNVPPWMRELLASGVTRHSRASSIISTRTRFSTNTFQDDARSIDINVGGQYFRISRDGSRISDAPPPPYSGPINLPVLHETTRAIQSTGNVITPPCIQHNQASLESSDNRVRRTSQRRRTEGNLSTNLRANILDPTEFQMPSPVDRNDAETASLNDLAVDDAAVPARIPSYRTGPDLIHVPSEARKLRTVSQNDVSTESTNASAASPLRRRNGVRLPSLITQPAQHNRGMSSTSLTTVAPFKSVSGSPLCIRSAGPVLSTLDDNIPSPQSPTYIGRNAEGLFPPSKRATSGQPPFSKSQNSTKASTSTPALHADLTSQSSPISRSHTPPPMDNENDISLHYTRMMRQLDHDHRKIIHQKDKELATYRERLNEVDVVYRQELKSRDFIIEDLKKRLMYLEGNVEEMLEKARNQVEDLWEKRWKEREICLREDLEGLVDRLKGKQKSSNQRNIGNEEDMNSESDS